MKKMTMNEMAIYLTKEGYDVLLNPNDFSEYDECLVTELAVEKEGYEFHYATELWQPEEFENEGMED